MRTTRSVFSAPMTAALLFWHAFASAAVVTTFSTGFEGWAPVNPLGLSWQSAGGNPGGYVQFDDLGPADGGQIVAPGAYLGDWSPADGVGSLSLDYAIFAINGGVPFSAPTLVISGPGGSATWLGPVPAAPFAWTNFVAPISAGAWSVSSGTWTGILTNVTELRVMLPCATSVVAPGESTGVDNITLTIPTPSAGIVAVGGCSLLLRRRR